MPPRATGRPPCTGWAARSCRRRRRPARRPAADSRQVAGGGQERAADRRATAALERLDPLLERVARRAGRPAPRAPCRGSRGRARDLGDLAPVDAQADVRVVGQRRDHLAQRRLGGVEPRAAVPRVVVHRLRAVEDDQDGALLRRRSGRRGRRRRSGRASNVSTQQSAPGAGGGPGRGCPAAGIASPDYSLAFGDVILSTASPMASPIVLSSFSAKIAAKMIARRAMMPAYSTAVWPSSSLRRSLGGVVQEVLHDDGGAGGELGD